MQQTARASASASAKGRGRPRHAMYRACARRAAGRKERGRAVMAANFQNW
ncbi:MAG: hypothetical protein LBG06_09725 [Deltaproteobacteria bacterium]|nr:hypothetical protein [Deltaproteobacteria bacterium]